MAESSTRCHLLVEPYCVLCRQDVKLIEAGDVRRGAEAPEPWEEEVFCFFSIPASGAEPDRNHMFRFQTGIEGGMFVDAIYNKRISDLLLRRNTVLCYGCGECQLENTANLMHTPCYQLATARLGRLSIQLLCDLAWLLRPIVSWRVARRFIDSQRCLSQLPESGISASTQAGSALHTALEKLPVELQEMICQMIPLGPFQSLVFTLDTLAWIEKEELLLKQTPIQRSLSTKPLFCTALPFNSLQASMTDILGEVCLSILSSDSNAADSQVSVLGRPIEGLQYALGTYGVLATRIHYRDGSTSPWLGEHREKWMKFIRIETLQKLQVQSDGYKILSLECRVDEVERHDSLCNIVSAETKNMRDTVQIIWDHDMGSLADYKCSLFDVSVYEDSVRGDPNSRFAQYLAFPKGTGSMNTLTLHCNPSGTSCIQINGDDSLKLGSPTRTSTPITFYLRPFEEIDSIYLVARRSSEAMFCQGPYLLVRTSLDRCLYYGLYIMPSWNLTAAYVSAFGNECTHRAVGVFIDPAAKNTEFQTCIGVVQESRLQTQVQPTPLSMPALQSLEDNSFCSRHWRQAFLSKAMFYGARELQIQKENDRCTGILADFQDGRVEILGRWDPAKPTSISTLYQSVDAEPLRSITFIFSNESPHESFVSDIVINSDEATWPNLKWDKLSTELVWYFTKFYDMIQYWGVADISVKPTTESLPYVKVE